MIHIYHVGAIKDAYFLELINKYATLGKFKVCMLAESQHKLAKKRRDEETEKIYKKACQHEAYMILTEHGKLWDTKQLSDCIQSLPLDVAFFVGGPYGIDITKFPRENLLALSGLTFTHEMALLLFAEQIYRCRTIVQGKGYHK